MAFPVGWRERGWGVDFEEYYEEEDIPETASTPIATQVVHSVAPAPTPAPIPSNKVTEKAEAPKEKTPATKKPTAKKQASITSFFKKKWSSKFGSLCLCVQANFVFLLLNPFQKEIVRWNTKELTF